MSLKILCFQDKYVTLIFFVLFVRFCLVFGTTKVIVTFSLYQAFFCFAPTCHTFVLYCLATLDSAYM